MLRTIFLFTNFLLHFCGHSGKQVGSAWDVSEAYVANNSVEKDSILHIASLVLTCSMLKHTAELKCLPSLAQEEHSFDQAT
jgi:hypothetical protein